MIKYYCDICGTEITSENKAPDKFTGTKISHATMDVKKELTVSLVEVDLCGELESKVCKYCMLDAINIMDDRPGCE